MSLEANKEFNATDPKRGKVRVIPLSAIDDVPNHPFQIRDDEEMADLMESISTWGVINPVIGRCSKGERYALISGAEEKYACVKLGIATLPVIVRDLSREEAIILWSIPICKENTFYLQKERSLYDEMGALKSQDQVGR